MLTARRVETVKPIDQRQEIPDGVVSGLYLIVQPSGAKSWALRYRFRGEARKLTLGRYPGIELVPARDAAREALGKVERQIDPAREKAEHRRRGQDGSRLIETHLPRFIKHHRYTKKRKAWRELERQLQKDLIPALGQTAIEVVTPPDVRDILIKAEKRGMTVGVNRLAAAISSFFKWAVEDDLITQSPAVSLGKRHAETSRDRVLTDGELVEVWNAAGAVGGAYGDLVRTLALIGQRRGETVGMLRAELSDDGKTWEIPGARTKNGKPHDVPLSTPARAILKTRPKKHDAMFSNDGETPIGDWTKLRGKLNAEIVKVRTARGIDEEMPAWTLHDLRRTCATGLARLGIALHVIEKTLNHTGRSFAGVAGVYNRFEFIEERRRALDAWAAHVERIVSGSDDENVVPITAPAGRR